MSYIKENNKIYKVTTTKVLVDLKALKEQLAIEKAVEKPTDEELIGFGKMSHPYYLPTDTSELEAEIEKIEKDIKVVKKS